MLAQLGLGLTCLKLSLACFEICWEIFLHICNGYEIIVFTKGRVAWNHSFNLFDSDKDTVITKFPYSAYCYVFISNSADNVGQTYLGIHAKLSCWTQRMRRAQNWNWNFSGNIRPEEPGPSLEIEKSKLQLEICNWNLKLGNWKWNFSRKIRTEGTGGDFFEGGVSVGSSVCSTVALKSDACPYLWAHP